MNQGYFESIQDDDEVFLLIDVWLGEKTQPWLGNSTKTTSICEKMAKSIDEVSFLSQFKRIRLLFLKLC